METRKFWEPEMNTEMGSVEPVMTIGPLRGTNQQMNMAESSIHSLLLRPLEALEDYLLERKRPEAEQRAIANVHVQVTLWREALEDFHQQDFFADEDDL